MSRVFVHPSLVYADDCCRHPADARRPHYTTTAPGSTPPATVISVQMETQGPGRERTCPFSPPREKARMRGLEDAMGKSTLTPALSRQGRGGGTPSPQPSPVKGGGGGWDTLTPALSRQGRGSGTPSPQPSPVKGEGVGHPHPSPLPSRERGWERPRRGGSRGGTPRGAGGTVLERFWNGFGMVWILCGTAGS